MKYLLFLFLMLSSSFCFAQTKTDPSYLLLYIDQEYDVVNKRNYRTINAEVGCDAAIDIYKLMVYDNKKNAKNIEASFYTDRNDSAKLIYNYFFSATEILNYLAKKGFVLVTIYNDIFSDYRYKDNGKGESVPITTVGSRPVFCFKK